MTHQIRQTEVSSLLRAAEAAASTISPSVSGARLRFRHKGLLLTFCLFVLLPLGGSAAYLWMRAADQYASTTGFSIRKEDTSPAVAILGGLTDLGGKDSRDSDILYEFLQSQELVADLQKELNLSAIWSSPGAGWTSLGSDPVFAFHSGGQIEDLVAYWRRMVRISYDSGTGLIELRILAFDPESATRIAEAILERSSRLINELSAIAQEDAIRAARDDLKLAQERLRRARRDVTAFRNLHRLVDPQNDVSLQAGLLGELQRQLADAMIEERLLLETARPDDPRLKQVRRRISILNESVGGERAKLGLGGDAEQRSVIADIFGEYEALVADREFAEVSYTAALASFDAAQAEARRKSRYLAAYIRPTLAESSRYPERGLLLIYVAAFAFLAWIVFVMAAYSIKDRR